MKSLLPKVLLLPLSLVFIDCGDKPAVATHTRELGEACDDVTGCLPSLFCEENICRKICQTKDDCSNNFECKNNRCTPIYEKIETCGNGELDVGELCDDKNRIDGDGCSAQCAIELGWSCEKGSEGSICSKLCGNGRRDAGEACDDGNQVEGDGCSNCYIDDNYECNNWPSSCQCASGFQDVNNDGLCQADCAPCQGNMSCVYNDDGTAAGCQCADGMQDSNSDFICMPDCVCDESQSCRYEEGAAVCYCPEGTQDYDQNGTCEPTCESFLAAEGCGAYESCDDRSGSPNCLCTIYVKNGGSGNGKSWSEATGSLADALNNLATLRGVDEEKYSSCQIWIDKNYNVKQTATAVLDNISLIGGFDGESLSWQRKVENHSTLDGNQQVRLAEIHGRMVLDGMRFYHGRDGKNSETAVGGAVFSADYDDLQVVNCIFENNDINYVPSMGAVALSGGVVSFKDTLFFQNESNKEGGAIRLEGVRATIKNCSFDTNRSIAGGAIYSKNSDLVVSDSLFINNSSATGGDIYSTHDEEAAGSLNIDNCQFLYQDSGAHELLGGNIYNTTDNAVISNSIFANVNLIIDQNCLGGAIYNGGQNVSVVNSIFEDITVYYDPYAFVKDSIKRTSGTAIYNSQAGSISVSYSNFNNIRKNDSESEEHADIIYDAGNGGLVLYNSLFSGQQPENAKITNSLVGFTYKENADSSLKLTALDFDSEKRQVKLTINNQAWEKGELKGQLLKIHNEYHSLTMPILDNGINYILVAAGSYNNSYYWEMKYIFDDSKSFSIIDPRKPLDNNGTQDSIVDKADKNHGPQPLTDISGRARSLGNGPDLGAYEIR